MRIQLLTALVLACALPAAHAQDEATAAEAAASHNPIILRVDSGNVMVSQQGAEFVTVEGDVTVIPHDRVLVPEASVASLDYGDGCVIRLVTGAYPVAEECPDRELAVLPPAGNNTAMIVGGVAGALALAALAGGGSSSSTPPQPVSP